MLTKGALAYSFCFIAFLVSSPENVEGTVITKRSLRRIEDFAPPKSEEMDTLNIHAASNRMNSKFDVAIAEPVETNFEEEPVDTNFQEEELPVETNFEEKPVDTNFQKEELPVETNFEEKPVDTNFQKEELPVETNFEEKPVDTNFQEEQLPVETNFEEIEEKTEEVSIEDTMTEEMINAEHLDIVIASHVEDQKKSMKRTKAKSGNLLQSSNTMLKDAFGPNVFHSKADGTYSCCVSSCEWFCLDIDGECLQEEDVWYCVLEVDD